jgi:hypothetical protein
MIDSHSFLLPPNDVDITVFLDLNSVEGRLLLLELILLTGLRTSGTGTGAGTGAGTGTGTGTVETSFFLVGPIEKNENVSTG